MDVKVRFRFNKVTGEVEVFEVADTGRQTLPDAEHNRQHDRLAAEVGNILERNPLIREVFPGAEPRENTFTEPGEERTALSPRERQTE